jgi:hypothetical protein
MHCRKFFRRHLCSEQVSVARLTGSRSVQVVEGNLEEIGEWSALILTQNALSRGTKVRIWGKSHKIKGYVRSCKYDRMLGFFVDIGLDPGSRWSEKWFRPEHLFSLCPSMRYFTEAVPKVPEKFLLPKTAHV